MKLGTELMVQSLHEIEDGTVKGYKQTEKGNLYLDSMTTVRHFRELHKKLKRGLINQYLTDQKRINNIPHIIE